MFEWMKKRASTTRDEPIVLAPVARPRGRQAGKYQRLYEYLENRYADTVVLTFHQVEDLLGFTLPDLARQDLTWWAVAGASTSEARWSDAWTLASRTAQPNLRAQTVVFQRVA
jgi:hypothetical protein